MPTSNQKKIRDLQRLMRSKGDSLSAEAREGLEKRIQELQHTKEEHKHQEVKRKHEQRYQMVKFFERKKVSRMLLSLEKKIAGAEGAETEELKARQARLLDDLTYIMYYPVSMKYAALYAHSEDGDDLSAPANSDHKAAQMTTKARAMAQQARQQDLERGLDKVEVVLAAARAPKTGTAAPAAAPKAASSAAASQKGKTTKAVPKEEDSDSDSDSSESSSSDAPASLKRKQPPSDVEGDSEGQGGGDDSSDSSSDSSSGSAESADERLAPTSKAAPKVAPKSVVAKATEADAFFVEEAPEDDGAAEEAGRESKGFAARRPSSASAAFKQTYHQVKQAANKRKFANHQSVRAHKGEQFGKTFGGGEHMGGRGRGGGEGGRGGFGGRGGGGRGGGGRGGGGRGRGGGAPNKKMRFD